MPDSYTNLLYHFVFSTKDRRPLITPDHEVRLYDYIGGTVRKLGGISLALNGTADHVHLLPNFGRIAQSQKSCES